MDLEKLKSLTMDIKDANIWLSDGLFALGIVDKDLRKSSPEGDKVFDFIFYSVCIALEESSQLADDLFDAVREK